MLLSLKIGTGVYYLSYTVTISPICRPVMQMVTFECCPHTHTHTSMLFTCSVDKTGAVWDSEVGERIKKLKGHTSFVNTCCPTRRGVVLLATGSDDGNIKVGRRERVD